MYIKKLVSNYLGPTEKINFEFTFNENGNPKPIILVGENGSGKSIILSNIIDSFYEAGEVAFSNATQKNANGQGHQYFKVIDNSQIKIGAKYMCSYIEFCENDQTIKYIFKSGEKNFEEFCEENNLLIDNNIKWNKENNFKKIDVNKEKAEKIFDENVIVAFDSDRYERPSWMGKKYYDFEELEPLRERWNGELSTPIMAKDVTSTNLKWMLDIIIDSRADIEKNEKGELNIVNVSVQNLLELSIARHNIEEIMSAILGKDVFFGLNFRNSNKKRFNIRSKTDGSIIIPTLDSLSTGQIVLFNLFTTIIRYADMNDISKSISIADIKGIVVIDEIELHLHSKLQRDILPKLIKMFPKVQFIITSHSPLFLLGMDECFGEDGYEIYEMPYGIKIKSERFSEFQKAYNYLSETQYHQNEIKKAIEVFNNKLLVVTEGATDWKHMLAAYKNLQPHHPEIFDNLEFDFLQYESKNSDSDVALKLEMGDSSLLSMCEAYSKINNGCPIIFIADRDKPEFINKFTKGCEPYCKWGNKVFSFVLPVPKNRKNTPNICIEHLYSDEEIKTPVIIEGIERRLYMGNEFDKYGMAYEIKKFCTNRNICGTDKINIIEGSAKDKVFKMQSEEEINYALPKMDFANKVLNGEELFDKFNFDNFLPIFKCIKEINDLFK